MVEFVAGLLQRMRAGEAAAGRSAPWPRGVVSATSACTHVDRLFAHLREARARCVVCGRVRVEFTESSVLELPLRADDEAFVSVTDLYVEYCRLQPSSEDGTTVFCDRCERRTEWWVQGRVVRVPNVLLVQVRRTARDGTVRRFPVQVEEHLTLPELPPLELSSVVYRDGASMDFGHYTCACRAPDGRFWFFDDVRRPACVPEISLVKPRSVYVLVYTTPRGCSAFADQGGVPPGDDARESDGGSASVAGPVLGGAAASSGSAGAAAVRGAATAGKEAPVFVPRLRPICSVCGERQRDLPPECSCVASRNRDRACAEGAEQDRRNELSRPIAYELHRREQEKLRRGAEGAASAGAATGSSSGSAVVPTSVTVGGAGAAKRRTLLGYFEPVGPARSYEPGSAGVGAERPGKLPKRDGESAAGSLQSADLVLRDASSPAGACSGEEGSQDEMELDPSPRGDVRVYDVVMGLRRVGLGAGVWATLEREFGDRAMGIVNTGWAREWYGWRNLVASVAELDDLDDEVFMERSLCLAADTVRRFLMLAAQNSDEVFRRDDERIRLLEQEGFTRGQFKFETAFVS